MSSAAAQQRKKHSQFSASFLCVCHSFSFAPFTPCTLRNPEITLPGIPTSPLRRCPALKKPPSISLQSSSLHCSPYLSTARSSSSAVPTHWHGENEPVRVWCLACSARDNWGPLVCASQPAANLAWASLHERERPATTTLHLGPGL